MPKISFEQWMIFVNKELKKLYGITADDIADYCYKDAWANGKAPLATAKRAFKADSE